MIAESRDGGATLVVAAVLDLLAAAVARPGRGARARAEALLADPGLGRAELVGVARAMRELAATDGTELETEFVRLFQHGTAAPAHPYESFYRTGYLMDAGCLDELDALFSAAGVRPEEQDRLPHDHLTVELEFLALLLRGASTSGSGSAGGRAVRRIASGLLRDHLLPFAQAFCARLALLRPASYYAALTALLTAALTAADRELSGPASTEHRDDVR